MIVISYVKDGKDEFEFQGDIKITLPDHLSTSEFLEVFWGFLVTLGHHPNNSLPWKE